MKRNTFIITLVILAIIGSIVTFYTSNLLLSDVSNNFYGFHDVNFISSLPGFFFALDFILASIFVIRYYRYPDYKKKTINLYTIILAVFSLLGFVFSILTGAIIYRSFITPYPFFGYTIISLIVHLLLIVSSICVNMFVRKKLPQDTAQRKYKFSYIIYSIVFPIALFFAYNRFGAFLLAPFYVQFRTLYMTFVFYLSLLLPISLMIHVVLYYLDFYKKREGVSIIVVVALMVFNLILGIETLVLGANNTQFISAVSPALAIERLITLPVDTVAQFAFMFVITLYFLFYALKSYRRSRTNAN